MWNECSSRSDKINFPLDNQITLIYIDSPVSLQHTKKKEISEREREIQREWERISTVVMKWELEWVGSEGGCKKKGTIQSRNDLELN